MKGMFNKCYYLENIPNISKWDLKNVNDKSYISYLFDSSLKSDKSSLYKFSSSFHSNQSNQNSESLLKRKSENIKYEENYENIENFEDLDANNYYEYYKNFYD